MQGSISVKKNHMGNGLLFRFDHLEDAKSTYNLALQLIAEADFPVDWQLRFIKSSEYHGQINAMRQFEGQVNVKLFSTGFDICDTDLAYLQKIVMEVVWQTGDIFAWKVQDDTGSGMFMMRIEMSSCDAADTLVRHHGEQHPLPDYPVSLAFLSTSSHLFLPQHTDITVGLRAGRHKLVRQPLDS
jgi:hypothetical protein